MIFMALLPDKNSISVSHGGGYPAVKDLWETVEVALKPRLGEVMAGGRYRLSWILPDALGIVRTETRSTVRVTRKKAEKTYARLQAGEAIPFRDIDYTVAIEFGVVLALGNLVEPDPAAKVYRLGKRV